jgi:hypothetical protein
MSFHFLGMILDDDDEVNMLVAGGDSWLENEDMQYLILQYRLDLVVRDALHELGTYHTVLTCMRLSPTIRSCGV